MKKLISLVLILCMACMLIPAMAADAADITGQWLMTEMTTGGQTLDPTTLGLVWTMKFEPDGAFISTMDMMGEKEESVGTWVLNGNAVTITVDGDAQDMAIGDGTLTLVMGDESGVFTRKEGDVSAAPAAPAATVAAEGEQAFLGNWSISAVEFMGQVIPTNLFASFGVELNVTLVVEPGKAVLTMSYNGKEEKKELDAAFSDGKLVLSKEGVELTSLELGEDGRIIFTLPVSEMPMKIYLSPAK